MKKILLPIIALLLVITTANAQELIGYYNNRFTTEQTKFKVQLLMDGIDGKDYVMVEVLTTDADEAHLLIDIDKLEATKKSIKDIKEKYVEWSATARLNNIKDMNEKMPINLVMPKVAWKTNKWWFANGFKWNLPPYFIVKDGTKYYAYISQEVSSRSNEYVTSKINLIFTSVSAITMILIFSSRFNLVRPSIITPAYSASAVWVDRYERLSSIIIFAFVSSNLSFIPSITFMLNSSLSTLSDMVHLTRFLGNLAFLYRLASCLSESSKSKYNTACGGISTSVHSLFPLAIS